MSAVLDNINAAPKTAAPARRSKNNVLEPDWVRYLLIVIKLEQYDYAGAAAIGLAMVLISFGALILINAAQIFLAGRGRR